MAQPVKDLALSLRRLESLLLHGVSPWPRNFLTLQVCPPKKKADEKEYATQTASYKTCHVYVILPVLTCAGLSVCLFGGHSHMSLCACALGLPRYQPPRV